MGLGGFLGGLATFLEKIGELAEKSDEFQKTAEIHGAGPETKLHGVYGFSIKVGRGDEGMTVEPFGNVHKDEQTGKAIVDEIREPLVDLFEEEDRVLVIAEMPGIGENDVQLDLADDILTISTMQCTKKYRKEVLLPVAFSREQMSHTCRNGVLEVAFQRLRSSSPQ